MPNDLSASELMPPSSPVEMIDAKELTEKPNPGIGLCLSGGGYRAMLFHVGSLWRLFEVGYLPKLSRISSVSGGSITAGVLGLAWSRLDGTRKKFEDLVVTPIRTLGAKTIDVGSIVGGVFGPGTVSEKVAKAYRKHLFGDSTLQDLPDSPRFVINATNVQSKALFRFSKPYIWDYRVGKIDKPKLALATAVSASSAFPPFLSPVELEFKESDYTPNTGVDLQKPPYTTDVVLTDGGVYDNLGLETVWKNYQTVLVSDAGGIYGPEPDPKKDWLNHTRRVFDLVDNQVRSLRKRQVIDSFTAGERSGAYWGIWTDIAKYELADALPCPLPKTQALAGTPTRLKGLESDLQEKIVNWGYAVCDAAVRKHVEHADDPALPKPKFPYPAVGVG